jgi:hypothetical protein
MRRHGEDGIWGSDVAILEVALERSAPLQGVCWIIMDQAS